MGQQLLFPPVIYKICAPVLPRKGSVSTVIFQSLKCASSWGTDATDFISLSLVTKYLSLYLILTATCLSYIHYDLSRGLVMFCLRSTIDNSVNNRSYDTRYEFKIHRSFFGIHPVMIVTPNGNCRYQYPTLLSPKVVKWVLLLNVVK